MACGQQIEPQLKNLPRSVDRGFRREETVRPSAARLPRQQTGMRPEGNVRQVLSVSENDGNECMSTPTGLPAHASAAPLSANGGNNTSRFPIFDRSTILSTHASTVVTSPTLSSSSHPRCSTPSRSSRSGILLGMTGSSAIPARRRLSWA